MCILVRVYTPKIKRSIQPIDHTFSPPCWIQYAILLFILFLIVNITCTRFIFVSSLVTPLTNKSGNVKARSSSISLCTRVVSMWILCKVLSWNFIWNGFWYTFAYFTLNPIYQATTTSNINKNIWHTIPPIFNYMHYR